MIDVYDSYNHRNFWDAVLDLGGEVCYAPTVWDLASTDDCDGQVSDCDGNVMVQVCDNNANGNMTCRNNRPLYKLHNC